MPTCADYAKIHIAVKALGLSDAEYRYLLRWKFKVSSSKDLSSRQVTVLLNYFKAKGWRPTAGKKGGKNRPQASDPQSRKIRALWISMYKARIVHHSSEKAIAAYVKRITGVEALQWCSPHQKHIVIESLKAWEKRYYKGRHGR